MSLREQIKAILFDLDGTLIDVNLKLFVPEYLKLLASNVSHLVRQSKFISKLMVASQEVDKNNGNKTNEQVFEEAFFPLIGYAREEMNPLFDKFYEQDFPKLRQYTTQKPDAREVMQMVFKKGYDVVIATTPLLPETAVRQRLEWAGVPVDEFPYKLITSLENTSANKPNLLYYKLIAETIGRSTKECLMVGDEDKDMIAAQIGMKTFLVQSSNTELGPNTPEPDYQGTLADLQKLL